MNFKKAILVSAAVLAAAGIIAGCGDQKAASSASSAAAKETTIKVGVSPVPHAEIVGVVKDKLAKEGVKVEMVEFTDYVQPNLALADKSLDANFFQHKPYLDEFCKSKGLKLTSLGAVHLEPMCVYSKKLKSLNDLADGAHVAIPNDPTNGGRALLILAKQGLIKVNPDAGLKATPADVTENPKNIQFSELDAAQLPRSLDDVDAAVINTNYAMEAGLHPKTDAIAIEDAESPYANVIVVKSADKDAPWAKTLVEAYHDESIKAFINEEFKGALIPSW